MTVVIIWVDDVMIALNCTTMLKNVKGNLSKRFQMKDMGKLSWFLGIEFTCKEGMIETNQTNYIERVCQGLICKIANLDTLHAK